MIQVIDECPRCGCKLRPILDNNNFIIDWWCESCGIGWDLEDLDFTEAQIGLERWF